MLEPQSIQPLNNAYFAGQTSEDETQLAQAYAEEQGFDVIDASADDIAKLLYWERLLRDLEQAAEFGARALGNRSIIAILVNMM